MKFTLAIAATIMAVTGVAASAEEEKAEAPEKERLICKSEKVTGSRARVKRICMTRTQWAELSARTKEQIDQYSGRMTSTRDGEGQSR